jgi:hypothetical protein
MNSGDNNLAKKAIAVIVIVTLLGVIGIPPAMMLFMTGVIFVVWFVVRRSENRQLERIFEFYICADAILRDEERRLYGFEIAEVIENGERALEMMPDSPPLHYFALGALYHQMGNYEATAEYLSRLLEDEAYDERHRTSPSPQLRRYVAMLRRIEYEPSTAPQTLAAVRNLERVRRKRSAQLLAESRVFLNAARMTVEPVVAETPVPAMAPESREDLPFSSVRPLTAISAPPPISEVLNDIYRDDKTTIH